MSSIDKYVENEARRYNSNVSVRTSGGYIIGTLNGSEIFRIADRYGYLNENERSIIRNSVTNYEAQRREAERLERERLERERVAAGERLRQDLTSAKYTLSQSYNSAKSLYGEVSSSTDLSAQLSALKDFDITPYQERLQLLKNKIASCISSTESDYKSKLQEIEKLERSFSGRSSTSQYLAQISSVKKINTCLVSPHLPVDELNALKAEVEKLSRALNEVRMIEKELKKVGADGLSGSIAQNTIKEIHSARITSLSDVNVLMTAVQQNLAQISDIEFSKRTGERSDKIALINGLIKSCVRLREYSIEQSYEAASYRREIVDASNKVLQVYSELGAADFSTCSHEKVRRVYSLVQNILIGTASDDKTLESLKELLEESAVYKRDDKLQSVNYADYRSKVEELTSRGMAAHEIEAFDYKDYNAQKRRLNSLLLKQDIIQAASQTKLTFLAALETMEEMGYRMLHCDMGGRTGVQDALACEAIYVRPGCDGVVWQVIASDGNLRRRIIGVERQNGNITAISRVREVAQKIEKDGEIDEFYTKYMEKTGVEINVTEAVDSDTEKSDEYIRQNGSFTLNEEGEKLFDSLVASASEQERAHWATSIPLLKVKQSGSVASYDKEAVGRENSKTQVHYQVKRG